MMSKLSILLLLAVVPALLLCQTISNVRVTQDDIGIYKAYFDLSGDADKIYPLSVTATKDGKTISPVTIAGTFKQGGQISAGKDLLLMWFPALDGYPNPGWSITLSAKDVLIPMAYVEGGKFNNGTADVSLSAYYIGKYEVTQQQWQEVMGNNPASFKGSSLPIEMVSWYDCVEFCNKLSRREGLTPCYSGSGASITCDWTANGYRLPTEAEWEYAAKGGNKSKGYTYAGSNDLGSVAWYDSNSGNKTHPVGTKTANELGLFDLSGNVCEWCWDWKGEYAAKSQTNPHGPGSGSSRVLRGGSWYDSDGFCRVTYRNSVGPDYRYYSSLGLRVLRAAQ